MRLSALVADILVAALLTVAALIGWTGGGRVEIAGVLLNAHSWSRPLIAAVLLFVASRTSALVRRRERPADVIHQSLVVLTAALAASALAVTAVYIIHACGGLDSAGYVAFSELLSKGHVSRPVPDLPWLTVDRPADVESPLGFAPSLDAHRLVPEFPPGLPILFAFARLVAGATSVFWVPWLCQIALVLVVFAIARTRYGSLTAGLAAVLMAAHPVASAYAMQAMSDVPATLATAVAVYALAARRKPVPAVAGLAASLAILIRPPLALPMAVLGAWALRRTPKAAWAMAAWTLPGLLGLMLLQYNLFGNPFVSGHGSAAQLFTLSTLAHNLAAHAKWFLVIDTPLVLPALWLGWRTDKPFAMLMFTIAFAEAFPYFFYGVPFNDWEMLRFLLPGIALLVPVAAEGVGSVLRRLPQPALAQLGVVMISAAVLLASSRWLDSHQYFALAVTEAKYPQVGQWLNEHAPPEAVVLASLHTGSVDYYSKRQTLRFDRIPADRLVTTLQGLAARGLPAYVVLDGSYEVQLFERRFASVADEVQMVPAGRIFATTIATIQLR